MIEKEFGLAQGETKTIERVLLEESIHYMHMILPAGEGLPPHNTNATVYMTVVRGRLSLGLAEQEVHEYPAGTLVKIPEGIPMRANNMHDETLELIVVKAPAPRA